MARKKSSQFKSGLVVGLASGILLSVTAATALLHYTTVDLIIKPKPQFEELKLDLRKQKQRRGNGGNITSLVQAGGKDANTDEKDWRVNYHRW